MHSFGHNLKTMQNKALFLGIDCSTTACKAIAWDSAGHAVAEGRAPISLHNPGPDAWEQDASSWLHSTKLAIREVTTTLGRLGSARIRALSITHQRETFVLTDEAGTPLHPALVWMDARCRPEVEILGSKVGNARIHAISGKYPCTTPSLYKLQHLLTRLAPEIAKNPFRVLDVGAFLIWNLTGRCVTSIASADPTGLVDMRSRRWSTELLSLLGLSEEQMPKLVEPGEAIGEIGAEIALNLGLPVGTAVFAGAGDGQSAALGAGILGPGKAYLNLGTAIVSGVVSPEYRIDAAFRTMMAAMPFAFLYETDLKGGTFTLSWLVEKLLGREPRESREVLSQMENEAASIPRGADGLVLLPYFHGVMNPYWDDAATGLLFGLHGGQGPAHVYRAILEGIALEQRVFMEGVEKASFPITEMVVLGGGSRSVLWCQILADVLDKPIRRAGTSEATSLGAGILAAYGAGLFSTIDAAAAAMTSEGEVIFPGEGRAFYDRLYRDVYVTLYPALRDAMSNLSKLREASAKM